MCKTWKVCFQETWWYSLDRMREEQKEGEEEEEEEDDNDNDNDWWEAESEEGAKQMRRTRITCWASWLLWWLVAAIATSMHWAARGFTQG